MTDADWHTLPILPPFLLTPATDRLGPAVTVIGDAGMAIAEVAAHGQWSLALGEQVSAAVRKCLAGPSASIIVDLRDLVDPDGVSVSFWLRLWQWAWLGTTPMSVSFCVPATAALSRRLRYFPGPAPRVFTAVAEARKAIAGRMLRADCLQTCLLPRPGSVKAARALVTQACHAWHLPELLQEGWSIVSELAGNAVEHARTDFIVTVLRSGPRLHVAVHDCVSWFPCPTGLQLIDPQAPLDERGRGLRLVHRVAAAWGAMPTHDGKVVWATVM
ncbi:ATP-binding protein [Paractinoplanes rishiriensis]|uniref:Histidine kinase/HSP90-like ATPase domain-containing protein n=1 Tax=Paractinoplanes rishiriensis TaxID=1050105 RepID=A0A919MZU1_9ACTN|nr:ATP-binding protein [Actinoplanes rishiriensis]GIF01964.1 hypothetical protein Ari01nite_94280 [Actinoplanes rishiriensis]